MIQTVVDLGLHVVFRMRKSKLQYRLILVDEKTVKINTKLNIGTNNHPTSYQYGSFRYAPSKKTVSPRKRTGAFFLGTDDSLDDHPNNRDLCLAMGS